MPKLSGAVVQAIKDRKRSSPYPAMPGHIRPVKKARRVFDGSEKKFKDTAISFTTVGTTGTVLSTSLNLVDQGNAQNEMIGRSITVKDVSIKALVRQDSETSTNASIVTAAGNLTPESVRLYIVLDRQCNGAAATVSQILEDTDIISFYNLENSKRFKILTILQAELPLAGVGLTHDGTNFNICTQAQDIFLSKHFFLNEKIEFANMAGGSRALTEVTSSNLLCFAISTTGSCRVRYRVRIRYVDA